MQSLSVLAVGQDPMILKTRCSILRAAGDFVSSASTIAEALDLFRNGVFDLVLLCHSVPAEDRDRLTWDLRRMSSHTPIYMVAPLSGEILRCVADGVISSVPAHLASEVERAVQTAATSVLSPG